MKLYKHGLFQREVVRHMFQTSYWLPVGGVVGVRVRVRVILGILGIPVVFGWPVVLRGVPFHQAFFVVCMHFRPYHLNYIIIHAHYSQVRLKLRKILRLGRKWNLKLSSKRVWTQRAEIKLRRNTQINTKLTFVPSVLYWGIFKITRAFESVYFSPTWKTFCLDKVRLKETKKALWDLLLIIFIDRIRGWKKHFFFQFEAVYVGSIGMFRKNF